MTQKNPEQTGMSETKSMSEMTGTLDAPETLAPETFVGYDAFLRDI